MFVCVCVARALGKDALGRYSIGTEGLGLAFLHVTLLLLSFLCH